MAYKTKDIPRAVKMRNKKALEIAQINARREEEVAKREAVLDTAGYYVSTKGLTVDQRRERNLAPSMRLVAERRVILAGRHFILMAVVDARDDGFSFTVRLTGRAALDRDEFTYNGQDTTLQVANFEDLEQGVLWSLSKLGNCAMTETTLEVFRSAPQEVSSKK